MFDLSTYTDQLLDPLTSIIIIFQYSIQLSIIHLRLYHLIIALQLMSLSGD